MDVTDLRYVVFAIDSRYQQHEGEIYKSHEKARRAAQEMLNDYTGTKMIIASFLLDPGAETMYLHEVEVIDSKTSKKKLNQLNLFR